MSEFVIVIRANNIQKVAAQVSGTKEDAERKAFDVVNEANGAAVDYTMDRPVRIEHVLICEVVSDLVPTFTLRAVQA